MILRLDRNAFPSAFASEGREELESLFAAAIELERDGCVRVVNESRGPHRGTPKEVRLGADELERAYAAAAILGYEPIATAFEAIARRARTLARGDRTTPDWYTAWLCLLADALDVADPGPIGMSRDRFKREWRELSAAITAAGEISRGIAPTWERVLSERIFNDSKRLARIRAHVVNVLVQSDPRWEGVPPDEAFDLLEAYGVRRKPGLIRCAGSGALNLDRRQYLLQDFAPAAHLPDAWAAPWVEALVESETRVITTVENEYPFLSFIEESGGPAGLGARKEVAVYTAGFPTPALVDALARTAARAPAIRFRHWGDADVGGIRIWMFLRTRIGRPLHMFRTTGAFVRQSAAEGAPRLSVSERRVLSRIREQLESVRDEDCAAVIELIDEMIAQNVKVEQERY